MAEITRYGPERLEEPSTDSPTEIIMRAKLVLMLLSIAAILLVAAFWPAHKLRIASPVLTNGLVSNATVSASYQVVTNESILDLRKLLVDDYHSTNSHDSVTSGLAHQLIAERLKTNEAFLEWATNITTAVIMRFATNGDVPTYGIAGLTAKALQFYNVTAQAPVGLHAEAVYDPHPESEGALIFVIEGGVNPTIQLIRNQYRMQSYQMDPDLWTRYPRKIKRLDWSCATSPLDRNQVDGLAQHAFREMTGLDLRSFYFATKIDAERILNPNALHPEVTVTGNLSARLLTPKDYLYPFATFKYGDSNFMLVPFSGEMVQTTPGHGEFVDLFAVLKKTEAVFELGEKFLGEGTWEQNMLDQLNSMNTEQRGEVYRRIFAR